MRKIVEAYRKIGDPEDRFDIEFWQAQGEAAIFQAAEEMIRDYEQMKGRTGDLRIDRTVECYGRGLRR